MTTQVPLAFAEIQYDVSSSALSLLDMGIAQYQLSHIDQLTVKVVAGDTVRYSFVSTPTTSYGYTIRLNQLATFFGEDVASKLKVISEGSSTLIATAYGYTKPFSAPVNTRVPSISGAMMAGSIVQVYLGEWLNTLSVAAELRHSDDDSVVQTFSRNGIFTLTSTQSTRALYLSVVASNPDRSTTVESAITETIS